MVIQVSGPQKDAEFVTSDSSGVDQCRLEIMQWIMKTGQTPVQSDRVFAIFKHGQIVREWNLLQKVRSQH